MAARRFLEPEMDGSRPPPYTSGGGLRVRRASDQEAKCRCKPCPPVWGISMPINIGDIFHGVTPAAVRNYFGEECARLQPELVIHPCVGRFGALTAAVASGVPAARHRASDLGLYSSIIGYLADPSKSVYDLSLQPAEECMIFFDHPDGMDEYEYAASAMLAMKYSQIRPANRYLENLRNELLWNRDEHHARLVRRLAQAVDPIRGIEYEARNLWDVVAELEQSSTHNTVVYMSMPWYRDDFTKQMAAAEAALGWPGLVGREFNPQDLPELLERVRDTGCRCYAHVGDAIAHLVPDGYKAVVAYEVGKDGKVDRLYTTHEVGKVYAPSPIRERNPKMVPIFDDHELTDESKLEIVPLDADTALYLRDLFVHRLPSSEAEHYYALTLDGQVAVVYGLIFSQVLGVGPGGRIPWVREHFGVVKTSHKYPRLNRLSPLALTSGDTRKLLLREHRFLRLMEPLGIQSTDMRHYIDSKTYKGVGFKKHYVEQQPDGTYKIVTRGPFREDTWEDVLKHWLKKWGSK